MVYGMVLAPGRRLSLIWYRQHKEWSEQGLWSLSGRKSYRKISWSLKTARLDVIYLILFVSLLSHFWLIHSFSPTPALSTMSRPLSSYMCSITPGTAKVGSGHMRGPGIGCWFSDRSNCSHWSFEAAVLPINPNIYIDHGEPIVIYHYITLLVLIQLCSQRCWHLESNYCRTRYRQSQLRFVLSPLLLHLRLLGTVQSDIPLFTLTWSAMHSPNQGWESTHRLHIYPWVVSFTPPSIEH